ncbi:hypothetical protein ACLOJK_033345 [Asimina triloba]
MTSLYLTPSTVVNRAIPQTQLRISASWKLQRRLHGFYFTHVQMKHLPFRCTNLSPWQPSPITYASDDDDYDNETVVRGSTIFESVVPKKTVETSVNDSVGDVSEIKLQSTVEPQLPKWPMWLLGPSVILVTGMAPTLWLPLSSVFLGPSIAGILSLVGLDCIFNLGATVFLLMANACAQPKSTNQAYNCQIPHTYKFWNIGANLVGCFIPLIMLSASYKGILQPQLPFIPFLALLGPYFLLLSIQMLTEMLTWRWRSPVWLVTPIVYEAYRILQLMRGLRLGGEIGVPAWSLHCIRGLVSWWVLILGMQLMRVAWFAGFASQSQEQPS